jgi:hypothetical protein
VPRFLKRFALLLAISMIPWSSTWAAQAYPTCPIGQTPSFSFGFASLHEQLGPTMGDPIECEHADPGTGDALQRTTTGIALYRRDTNTSMFTNGQEHWALTALGMAHWSGWHGSATPLGAVATGPVEGAQQLTAPQGPYMSVEAVTIVDVLDENGERLVVRREATPYLIETESGCASTPPPVGQLIFIVSSDVFAGQDSRAIFTLNGTECRITGGRPL